MEWYKFESFADYFAQSIVSERRELRWYENLDLEPPENLFCHEDAQSRSKKSKSLPQSQKVL